MARTHEDPDGVGRVIDLFPPNSHKAVERLLKRAREKEARQAGRAVQRALRGSPGASTGMGRLARELGRALSHRGAPMGQASVRQVSPTSGGRSFHFAHSVIKKSDAPKAATGAQGGAMAPGSDAAPAARARRGGGRAAAHMRYIEREVAVERLYGQGERGAGVEGPGREADGRDGGRERDPAEAVHATGASAGQGYVENPIKLENGEKVVFSFGTIGDRLEDRLAFWEALEQAESHPEARVQHRLILELPHEASPAARFEMVRRFCEKFEDDAIPFWAALHAPGPKNDSRNFHAHIVYSERPAKRMAHPETGEAVWDFEVTRTYKKKSRNTVTSRPHRQDKLRAYTARDFVRTRRSEFAAIANEVLERDEVSDRLGRPVRYDARSYKAMGVDAVPMRSINRIVADRARDGATTVLDADYTSRMIAAELREAAARRDKDVLALVALDDAVRAATASGKAAVKLRDQPAAERKLPTFFRGPDLWKVPRAALKAASDGYMAARHEALRTVVMERATTAALERIVEATAPEALAATARGKAGKGAPGTPDAPDTGAARLLHEAALEEIAEVRRSAEKAKARTKYRIGIAAEGLRRLVTPAPVPSKTLQDALRRQARAKGPARETPAAGPPPPGPRPGVERPAASAGVAAGLRAGIAPGAGLDVADAVRAGGAGMAPPTAGRRTPGAGGAAPGRPGTGPGPGAGTGPGATPPAKPPVPRAGPATAAPSGSRPAKAASGLGASRPPGLHEMRSSLQPITSEHLKAVAEQGVAFIRAANKPGSTAEERAAMIRQMVEDFGGKLAAKRATLAGMLEEDQRRSKAIGVPSLADLVKDGGDPITAVVARGPATAPTAAASAGPSTAGPSVGPRPATGAPDVAGPGPTGTARAVAAREEGIGGEAGRARRDQDEGRTPSREEPAAIRAVSEGDEAATGPAVGPASAPAQGALAAPAVEQVEMDFGVEPEEVVDEAALDAADDVRRRKKNEDDKRRQMRKAVLGRRNRPNRGWER